MKKILPALIGLLFYSALCAQADEFDSTFGKNGIAATSLSGGANSIVIQKNNKIIAGGYYYNGSNEDFALVRYNSNGKIDNTFGENGQVINDFDGNEYIASVSMQIGKIIATGNCGTGFCLVRYNANGSIDSNFGTNGRVMTDFNGKGGICHSSVVQSDEKIIAVGVSNYHCVIVRYNVDGKIDSGFGLNGILTVNRNNTYGQAVSLQTDGRIVVIGTIFNNGPNFLAVRCNPDGKLDTTFGTKGIVSTDFGLSSDDFAYASAIDSKGKIYAAGLSSGDITANYSDFSTARYKPTGQLDKTFGNGGKVLTTINNYDDGANVIALMPDGKIIVAGELYYPGGTGIVRYNADGSLDNSYGNNGELVFNFTYPTSAAIQPDGKLLLNTSGSFAIMRFKAEMGSSQRRNNQNFGKGIQPLQISLSPNPAQKIITITGLNPTAKKLIEITGTNGLMVYRQITNENSMHCDVSQLQQGTYYVYINQDGEVIKKTFIKQ